MFNFFFFGKSHLPMSKKTMLLKSKSKGKNLSCYKKKKSYFCQGEGVWNNIKTDATAEKSASSVGMLSPPRLRWWPHVLFKRSRPAPCRDSQSQCSVHKLPWCTCLWETKAVKHSRVECVNTEQIVWRKDPHFQIAGENAWPLVRISSPGLFKLCALPERESRGLKKTPPHTLLLSL